MTDGHDQVVTHRYLVHFPEHGPRESDPHWPDFQAFHRKFRAVARCYVGEHVGYDGCKDAQGNLAPDPGEGAEQVGLELHHAHLEFALTNGASFAALEKDYPGISDPSKVGAWVESDQNFRWLCVWHHRGQAAGAHAASHSDWEGNCYVPDLLRAAP